MSRYLMMPRYLMKSSMKSSSRWPYDQTVTGEKGWHMRSTCLLACVVTLSVSPSVPAGVIEVGPGDSIQDAIVAAVDGDEIVVAPGTYLEAVDFLGKAITLRSSDGPDVTVIDGTGNFHVVQCVNDEGPDTVLDGFTVTGGDAHDGGKGVNTFGAGMFNENSCPTVRNCIFTDNYARLGGGMFNGNADPTVIDCVFLDNVADLRGGGMSNVSFSNATVIGCTFIGNVAVGSSGCTGGGMDNQESSPTVTDCVFIQNAALGLSISIGGGMACTFPSTPIVTRCTFVSNVSAQFGGGLYASGAANAVVTDCTFRDNAAAARGGGVYCDSSSPTMTNCTFAGNSAVSTGGGVHAQDPSSPTVANCTFYGNEALVGGGIYSIDNANPAIRNSILRNNDPPEVTGGSVAYSNVQGGVPGIGNIDADPFFVDPDNGDFRLLPESPCIDAADNDAVPEAVTTDLNGNPRFLEIPETPDTGNGTLPIVDMGAYEALGAGCLAVTAQEVVCQADGETFTVNVEGLNACTGGTSMFTFTGSGGDVGEAMCFTVLVNDGGFCCSTEICVTVPDCSGSEDIVCPADLDHDGQVGVSDFLIVLGSWGGPGADINGDGTTDINDFLIALGNWGPCA